ncbi:MAG: aminotransferase class V-fold PLP-dependent enzyme [Gemmataceae bacterium]
MPEVEEAVRAAFATGEWGLYRGEHVPKLESELAAFHDVPYALTCGSGTLAVEIALRALGVRAGDEVVMAAYDYESNFLSIHALGATPVLADVSPRNGNLDPGHLEAAISPSTRALIASHLHAGLVPMRSVMEFARSRNIGVVEDAAQAAGATVEGKPAGSWGDVGTLSFGGSKLLTAGRGGALLFRDPQLHQRARNALHRGIQPWAPLSELQAIVLRPQLKQLPTMTRLRSERAAWLKARIAAKVEGLHPFENDPEAGEPAYYKLGFHYDADAFGLSREEFVRAMRAEGVAFDAGFKSLHIGRSPSRFRAAGSLPTATALQERCVVLHHPVLSGSEADVAHVVDALLKARRHRSVS